MTLRGRLRSGSGERPGPGARSGAGPGEQDRPRPGEGASPYQVWADFLERWAAGGAPMDTSRLPVLGPGDLPADTWQRLLVRIGTAVDRRLQDGMDTMTGQLAVAPDEFVVGRTLNQARDVLRSVAALLAHPSLPEDIRTRLTTLLDEHTRTLQQSLEDGLDRAVAEGLDAREAEVRRRTLRDNPLTAAAPPAPAAPGSRTGPAAPLSGAYDPAGGGRRRVTPD